MGWLSRLLGEMPDETQYRSSHEYSVRETENTTTVENYSDPNKSEDAAKLFLKAFESQHDRDDELGSFEALEEKMQEFSNEGQMNSENLKKMSSAIGTLAGIGFAIAIAIVFFSSADTQASPIAIMIFILIFVIAFSLKSQKKIR